MHHQDTWCTMTLVNQATVSASAMWPHPSMSSTSRAAAAEVRNAVLHCHVWMYGTNGILRYDTATDDSPFFENDMPTMRSSSSSSDGLPPVTGLNWEGSVESNEVGTPIQTVSVRHQMRHKCCSDSESSSARILTSAGKAALAEWLKVITQNAKVVMEAMRQLTPVVWLIVVWGHTLVLHPPTQDQRHINVYSFIACEIQTDSFFLWSVLVWHGTNSSTSAGSSRVPGTNWLF